MDREKLEESKKELDVTQEDEKIFRKEHLKELLIYPVIGALIVAFSAFLGWYMGKEDPKSVDVMGIYPYESTTLPVGGLCGPIVLGGALLTLYTARKKREQEKKKAIILGFITTIMVTIISISAYVVAYDLSQPVEYWASSGPGYAILYNVYSREEKRP